MIAFLDNELLVRQIGWTLLHTLWQGVVLALLLAVALRVMRQASSDARYVVACAAMLFMVTSAVITFARLSDGAVAATPRVSHGIEAALPPVPSQPSGTPAAALTPPQRQPDILRYVVTSWLAGVATLAIWHVGGWLLLLRLRRGEAVSRFDDVVARLSARLGVRCAVRVVEAARARIDVPAVIGVLRPVILVPVALLNGLAPQQVEAILAHELAHVRRHDYLVNLIQSAIETLMFYHPATWWISMIIRRERENCCDDMAARACGDARAYAAALAALEARRLPSAAARLALAANGGELLDRVRRVLKLPPLPRPLGPTRSLAAAAMAVVCVAVPLACVAQDKPTKAEAAPATPAASSSPATTRASEHRAVKVVIGKVSLFVDGKEIAWPALNEMIASLPEPQRRKTVLEVAAAAPDVTVERFFTVAAGLHDLVKQHGLAYLSQTGIHPTDEPRARPQALGRTDPMLLSLLNQRLMLQAQLEQINGRLGHEHRHVKSTKALLERMDERIAEYRSKLKEQAAAMSVEQIAAFDATMRQYVNTLEAMEFDLQRLRRNVGQKHRTYLDAMADLELQAKRVSDYAAAFRKAYGEGVATTQPE